MRRDLFDARSRNALLARNSARAGSKKLKLAVAALTDPPPLTNSRITHERLYRDPAGVIADLTALLAPRPNQLPL